MGGRMAENDTGDSAEAVRIEIMFKEYASFIKVYMPNITNGGLFIRTDNPLPLDAPVKLRMRLPEDTQDLEVDGRVVWTFVKGSKKAFLPKGMGIQFVNMRPEYAQKIKKIVDRFRNEIDRSSIM
jgi:type IV pilus assembly protein PilZ